MENQITDTYPKIAKWRMIVALILDITLTLFIIFVIFRSDALDFIQNNTNGWIQVTLIVNIFLLLAVLPVLFYKSGLKFKDISFSKEKIKQGCIFFVIFWGVLQLVNLMICLIQTGDIIINSVWIQYGIGPVCGTLIAQLFGNALYEEILFRGILYPQTYQYLINSKWKQKGIIVIAFILSQGYFALKHVPIRIFTGVLGWELIGSLIFVFCLGILFLIIYLRTNNLLVAICVHSLWNYPTSIFAVDSTITILILVVLLLIFWPHLAKNF